VYTIDETGYAWRPRPAPFFGTRVHLLQLFYIAALAKIRAGTRERKRRVGSRTAGAPKPPGSKLKRAALRHKRHATWG
jgi:hypothetical protein